MGIFPFLEPDTELVTEELPVLREVKWDFKSDMPIYEYGNPVIVERGEAVAVWAWNALHTERFQHEIYTSNYGSDVQSLIGQTYSGDLKRSEAASYIEDCLLQSPYITEITDMDISFCGDTLTAKFKIQSVYGEIEMEV